jgi:hypothetical protein
MKEKLVEWMVLVGETETLVENLPRRHFVHHKSHLPYPGANLGRRGGKPATNRFSYGAIIIIIIIIIIITFQPFVAPWPSFQIINPIHSR